MVLKCLAKRHSDIFKKGSTCGTENNLTLLKNSVDYYPKGQCWSKHLFFIIKILKNGYVFGCKPLQYKPLHDKAQIFTSLNQTEFYLFLQNISVATDITVVNHLKMFLINAGKQINILT